MTQTLKGASKAAFIRNAHVPLNVLKKLKQKKDIHEAARLETNSLASEGVRQWLADHFSDGNEFIIQELGKWFDEFRRSVGKDDSINVHRLEMIVSQTVVNHVQYALGNEHYDIWLYGQGQKPLEAMNPLKR